jgi:hypothetical protein
MAYDTEDVLLDIKRHLLDASKGVNSWIATINNQKGVTDPANYGTVLVLDDLNAAAVYMLNENVKMFDFKQFAGMTIAGEKVGDLGEIELTIAIKIHIADRMDGMIERRALRYRQALKKTFLNNRLFGGLKFTKMAAMETESYLDDQGKEMFRVVGYAIRTIYPSR